MTSPPRADAAPPGLSEFRPAPGAASLPRMIAAQASLRLSGSKRRATAKTLWGRQNR